MTISERKIYPRTGDKETVYFNILSALKLNPHRILIKGSVCSVHMETIDELLHPGEIGKAA